MKKIFTLIILLGSLSAAKAQDMQRQPYRGNTQLSISSLYGGNLKVLIDNRTYTVNVGNNNNTNGDLSIPNLSAGNHTISIRLVPNRGRGGYNSQAIRVLYDATVYLKENYQTDLLVNRFGRVFKDEQLITGNNDPSYPNQYPNQYPVYNQPMAPQSFTALKTTISNEAFDNSRLNIAKQAALNNYFTAAQVKEIMQIFSYENTRLDIAKTFYSRTTDKGNYFMVNDAFSYSSSKDALAEFIRTQN